MWRAVPRKPSVWPGVNPSSARRRQRRPNRRPGSKPKASSKNRKGSRAIRARAPERPADRRSAASRRVSGQSVLADLAWGGRSGGGFRGGFLSAGVALAGLLARGTRRRGLRLGQGLFLGATAVADHGEKISRDLVRGFGAGRIVLAQEIHQVRATHPVGKALGAAMAGRAIGRENRRAGFASLQILG